MSAINSFSYCNSSSSYSRWETREVMVGDVGIGGHNAIRVQSMTTTDTMDTVATVEQSIRMIEAGCELVRITAPSLKEAQNLENIKNELRKRGYKTPLIADIHFTPNAAELAARIVEKVRVNPGNYADKKKFETIEYSNTAYDAELERIRTKFTPLVKICKEYGTAMRIGTNHGSLSDRIMSRYGDTPLGMVESAMEFLRICEENNYHRIVLSMKASNPLVMVQAYRLLVNKMMEKGMNYPLHLGVTEAGEGEDGRIKSAVGIGTLLEDGLGDTIRVSLTEDPEFEMPVANAIAGRYNNRKQEKEKETIQLNYNPFVFEKRKSSDVKNIGGHNVPRIITDLSHSEKITPASLFAAGYNYSVSLDKWNISDFAADFIYSGAKTIAFELPGTLGVIQNFNSWLINKKSQHFPLFKLKEYFNATENSPELNFVIADAAELTDTQLLKLNTAGNVVIVIETGSNQAMAEQRLVFNNLLKLNVDIPVIVKRNYNHILPEQLQLFASTDLGGLFLDGFGDGIWIGANEIANAKQINNLSFGILQATRSRISKTEYISCPSCGRTLFDLQETTAKIRSRTDHLKGVKIGIMGCIVNGPGEMADADYGYVGTGPGKITLYKGKEVVKRNIPSEEAVDALINLIKEGGDWVEKVRAEELINGLNIS